MNKQAFGQRVTHKPLVLIIDNGRGLVSVMFFYVHRQHRLAGTAKFEFENGRLVQGKTSVLIHRGITTDVLFSKLKETLREKTQLGEIAMSFSVHIDMQIIFAEDEQPWMSTTEISRHQKTLVKISKTLLGSHKAIWAKATAKAISWL